jgi:Tfp pilus assembly protein PilF
MAELTPARALELGVAAHNAGKVVEAERFYRAILKSHPPDPVSDDIRDVIAQAYSYMGLILRDRGDINAYIDCCKLAVRMKPSSADALNNLGAAQQYNGDLEGALNSYRLALHADPYCAESYNNLGSALHSFGRVDMAIESFNKAIALKPNYANAYNNMGHAHHDKGDQNASIECYQKALQVQPDSMQAHNNLGNAFRENGELEKAIAHFDIITVSKFNPTHSQFWFNSQSQAIECLYQLGRYDEVKQRLYALSHSGDLNLRVAAVSAFVSQQLKFDDPYPFCRQPLDYFHVGSLKDYVSDIQGFAENLIAESSNVSQVWEPLHGVTKFGFQTSPTIFSAGKNCEQLEQILRREIANYHAKFATRQSAYIRDWPTQFDLRGWFVRLLKHGFQQPHNHPSGWLSGVIYLKTLETDSDAGAIELGLHGHSLQILDDSYPRIVHRPQAGDIIFFPSSLFHRTIPFDADTERCVIAFDLYRYSN